MKKATTRLLALAATMMTAPLAAQITAGSAGDHATIQAALEAAALVDGAQEVRIQTGTYTENLEFPQLAAGQALTVSGGWNAAFDSRTDDPALSIVDGNEGGRTARILQGAGVLVIQNLTLTGGLVDAEGGGLSVLLPTGDPSVELRDLVIRDNEARPKGSSRGGGAHLDARGDSMILAEDLLVESNRATTQTSGTIAGAGLFAVAGGTSSVTLRRLEIRDNDAIGTNNQINGGAVRLVAREGAQFTLEDALITENRASRQQETGCLGSALYAGAENGLEDASPTLLVDRVAVYSNPTELICPQVQVSVSDGGGLVFRNSVVANGSHEGVWATSFDAESQVAMSHLTVTGHPRRGIVFLSFPDASKPALSNSVAFGNGSGDLGQVEQGSLASNLVGVDPLFANAAGEDYRPLPGSPVLDAGVANPAGGRGPLDLARQPRLQGTAPDLGAFEGTAEGPPIEPCVASETTLCLNNDRFRVEVAWTTPQGESGAGMDVGFGSDDSGLFWFFEPENWELMIKVLDACPFGGHYWVFAAATTNVAYTLTVTDTVTGQARVYSNPQGVRSPAITDTTAFATCP